MTKNFSELHKKNLQRIDEINLRLSSDSLQEKEELVKAIIEDVKNQGDEALARYSKKFDNYDFDLSSEHPFRIVLDKNKYPNFKSLAENFREAILTAKERITKFHVSEFNFSNYGQGWTFDGDLGEKLGVRYKAIQSVAIYVPGGNASLVSTVLMTAIPARVAGVNRVVLLSPPPISKEILAAAEICGVDEVIALGGAQAIAAVTYGTKSIHPVDKIVGPGNIYVSLAKKLCFGLVGIDGIYGPSELAILADDTARADFIASDLLSQLEHGSGLESCLVVSLSAKLIDDIKEQMEIQIQSLAAHKTEKQIKTIRDSYTKWTALLFADDLASACSLINTYAPEHLEIQVKDLYLDRVLNKVTNAAAIFIGKNTCESLGDYVAGPSHCLPTGSTARFSSGLQCSDFLKRASMIDFSKVDTQSSKFQELIHQTAMIARAEKLEAHARAAELRLE